MNPEEKQLLERSLKLSEENNQLLLRIERRSRLAMTWGFIKLGVIAIPLVAGYIFLQPYFRGIGESYNSLEELISHVDLTL